jgi:hypothetical protein
VRRSAVSISEGIDIAGHFSGVHRLIDRFDYVLKSSMSPEIDADLREQDNRGYCVPFRRPSRSVFYTHEHELARMTLSRSGCGVRRHKTWGALNVTKLSGAVTAARRRAELSSVICKRAGFRTIASGTTRLEICSPALRAMPCHRQTQRKPPRDRTPVPHVASQVSCFRSTAAPRPGYPSDDAAIPA